MGWAGQFMAAGAGAFIGTLWAVRSASALDFAESFYDALLKGQALGPASTTARRAVAADASDPTWLAYTVYGAPSAKASIQAESHALSAGESQSAASAQYSIKDGFPSLEDRVPLTRQMSGSFISESVVRDGTDQP